MTKCVQCHKDKPGRFTRTKHASSGGWSKGMQLPYYYCYTCLPRGEGRDEAPDTMPKTPAKAMIPDVLPAKQNLVAYKKEGQSLIHPIQAELDNLEVVDAESYAETDALLGRIQGARRKWSDRIEKIIRPIRDGLNELYALNREVDRPLEALEKGVKEKMRLFKVEEQRQLQAAQQERDAEAERIRRQAEEAAAKEANARTNAMRNRLAAKREELEQAAAEVEAQELPEAVRGQASSTRPVKKWKVTNLPKFLHAITDGKGIPIEMIILNVPTINKYFKEHPEQVAEWPGIEVFDDVQIIGR